MFLIGVFNVSDIGNTNYVLENDSFCICGKNAWPINTVCEK